MSIVKIFNSFIYHGPKSNERFELLEDEAEDHDKNTTCVEAPKEIKDQNIVIQRRRIWGRNKKREITDNTIQDPKNSASVHQDLNTNLDLIKKKFNYPNNQDVVIRDFKVLQKSNAFFVYVEGMADKALINDYILRQLMMRHCNSEKEKITIDYIINNLIAINHVTRETEYEKIINEVLCGATALFIENCNECILIETRGFEKRTVTTPQAEAVIRGSQEAFVENMRTNITLVRKIIKNKDLVTEIMATGKTDHNTCAIMYIEGMTNPKIVQEVKKRIRCVDIDLVFGNGVLEQLIEDHPYSILPQILSTERPDRTAFFLMEGRVIVICDGTPYASVIPITFYDMFHTSEDSSLRWQYGTFMRIIRVMAFFISLFLPGIYLALVLYHQEMIPTELLSTFAKARENIPFPTVIELLAMEISFEIVREASIRVPGAIGQTLGIIGAVILGQAGVSAGIISPSLIIVVAITGLSNYAIPSFSMSFGVRILRFLFSFLGAIAGLYGIIAGIFVISGYACSMKSFGVPYFSPVSPKTKTSHKYDDQDAYLDAK